MYRTIAWSEAGVVMLDQRRLPQEEVYLTLRTPEEVAAAIRDMAIRGAPAIGVAAAMGIALGFPLPAGEGAPGAPGGRSLIPVEGAGARFEQLALLMAATRPTAVNLFWAIERMRRVVVERTTGGEGPTPVSHVTGAGRAAAASAAVRLATALRDEAIRIHDEDIAANRAMGRHGASLVPATARILTHCNAGALATAGYGTALGVVRAAVEAGKKVMVYADETRPFLQGARLTAWELHRDGIPVTVLTDGMAGSLFQAGEVDLVLVGADRIARNGDVANKIGTYPVAVLARAHRVPFYVAAPTSTIDLSLPDGAAIPIERRRPEEVAEIGGRRVVPEGVAVLHPAFDVTPHDLVDAIITERGVARAPFEAGLAALCAAAPGRR